MNGSPLLIGLAAIAGLAHLVGFIWLLVCAFKNDKQWGWLLLGPYLIAVAFSVVGLAPLGALANLAGFCLCIAFVVKFWKEAKVPFFVLLGSWLVLVVAVVGLVASFGGALRAQIENAAALPTPPPTASSEPSEPSAMPVRPSQPRVRQNAVVPRNNPVRRQVANAPSRITSNPVAAKAEKASEEAASPNQERSSSPASSSALSGTAKAAAWDSSAMPLAIECQMQPYDTRETLQSLTLVLSNAAPKNIRFIKMRLCYLDNTSRRVGDWLTKRELDPALRIGQTLELAQPAYSMPSTTRKTHVEVKAVEFDDGSEWIVQDGRP